ncbi:hypothetical protein ACLOJK_019837 [Asimina triloba]
MSSEDVHSTDMHNITRMFTPDASIEVKPWVGMEFASLESAYDFYNTYGLLFGETIANFKWLFETWLQAVGGVHPKTIITDQDAAIGAAITECRGIREQLKYDDRGIRFAQQHVVATYVSDSSPVDSNLYRQYILSWHENHWQKREAEEHADFQISNGKPVLKTRYSIEAQMAGLYTFNVFLAFQEEVEESLYYIVEQVGDDGVLRH